MPRDGSARGVRALVGAEVMLLRECTKEGNRHERGGEGRSACTGVTGVKGVGRRSAYTGITGIIRLGAQA